MRLLASVVTVAWQQGPNGDVNLEKGGDSLPLAISQAYRNAGWWWRPDVGGAAVVSDGVKPCENALPCADAHPARRQTVRAWFAASTHLLGRMVEKQGGRIVTIHCSDYPTSDGVRLPYTEGIDNGAGAKYRLSIRLMSLRFLPEQRVATYAPPKGGAGDFTIAGGATRTTFPFRLRNNHIYADAR